MRLVCTSACLMVLVAAPAAADVTPGAKLAEARGDHTATLLPDGRVLVVGGCVYLEPRLTAQGDYRFPRKYLATTELWDPKTAAWTKGPKLKAGRCHHGALLLADGRVMVAGGEGDRDATSATTELWDPAGKSGWTKGPKLTQGQNVELMGRLADGRIALLGTRELEVLDLAKGAWSAQSRPSPETPCAVVSGSSVLFFGGTNTYQGKRSPFDVCMEWNGKSWSGKLPNFPGGRTACRAVALGDGSVLVVGGTSMDYGGDWEPLPDSLRLSGGKWLPAGTLPRQEHALALRPDGTVLAIGGRIGAESAGPALWSNGVWKDAGAATEQRLAPAVVALPDGRVLVIGGRDGASKEKALASTLIWAP